MKHSFILTLLLLTLVAIIAFTACSEKRTDSRPPATHNAAWTDSTADNFHGYKVDSLGTASCKACHGDSLHGSTTDSRTVPNCIDCHRHPSGVQDTASADFHGRRARTLGTDVCKPCHGADLNGGFTGVSCQSCHHNPATVMDTLSPDFHGTWVINADATPCKRCHGDDLRGGYAGRNCFDCHHDRTTILDPSSEHFHGQRVTETGSIPCTRCHGNDYQGGFTGTSCRTCHSGACNQCHGSSNNFAPPRTPRGITDSTYVGVGAHQKHVRDGSVMSGKMCDLCHHVTSWTEVFRSEHFDTPLPAEIYGGGAGYTQNASMTWTYGTATCTNTYCHGNFTGGAGNTSLVWNRVDGTQAHCGSCHALPPSVANDQHVRHVTEGGMNCSYCHSGIVDASNVVVDPSRHVDGSVNVVLSIGGMTYDPSAKSCTGGCHSGETQHWYGGGD